MAGKSGVVPTRNEIVASTNLLNSSCRASLLACSFAEYVYRHACRPDSW